MIYYVRLLVQMQVMSGIVDFAAAGFCRLWVLRANNLARELAIAAFLVNSGGVATMWPYGCRVPVTNRQKSVG